MCRTEEMLESIRRAREAEEAESVACGASRRAPWMELTKPEIICRRKPDEGDASTSSSVGSSTPEKQRLLQPAKTAAGEVSFNTRLDEKHSSLGTPKVAKVAKPETPEWSWW